MNSAEKRSDGYKDDKGKTRWDLLDFTFAEEMAEVATFGLTSHEECSWKATPDFKNRYFSATMRHMSRYLKGEEIDPESGKSHLAHAAWNLMALRWKEKTEKGTCVLDAG